MTSHRRIEGRLVVATHNPGKLTEMRDLLAPYGIDAVSAGELGLASRRRPARRFRPMRGSRPRRQRRQRSFPRSPTIPASRSMRLAGQPGHPLGALGGTDEGFQRRDDPDRTAAAGTWRTRACRARRAFRVRALRRLAGRSSGGGRGAGRRHARLAAARHRRFRLRPGVPAGRPCAHLRRDDRRRRSTACRRLASACRTARAPS